MTMLSRVNDLAVATATNRRKHLSSHQASDYTKYILLVHTLQSEGMIISPFAAPGDTLDAPWAGNYIILYSSSIEVG